VSRVPVFADLLDCFLRVRAVRKLNFETVNIACQKLEAVFRCFRGKLIYTKLSRSSPLRRIARAVGLVSI
jgi:hypothetical protein